MKSKTIFFRALVKVSVCYGKQCSDSLDLWVIDSRCWHCSLEEPCEPKLHGPCFYYNPYYTEPISNSKDKVNPEAALKN